MTVVVFQRTTLRRKPDPTPRGSSAIVAPNLQVTVDLSNSEKHPITPIPNNSDMKPKRVPKQGSALRRSGSFVRLRQSLRLSFKMNHLK
jgi:hypothetical protein